MKEKKIEEPIINEEPKKAKRTKKVEETEEPIKAKRTKKVEELVEQLVEQLAEEPVEEPIKETKGRIKKRGIVLATLTIILIAVTCFFFIYSDSNNYVVKINDKKISMEEFEMYLKWQMGYMQENTEEEINWDDIEEVSGVPYIDLAKDLTVDLLTETKVQIQEAEKRDITLTEEEEEYIEALVKYSLSQSDELDTYELTEDDWIKIYKEYQIINKLTLEIANEELTPYDARHILLLTDGKPESEWPAIKKKAQDLLDRVLAGEDFEKLASENSEDGGSVNNGGLYKGVAKGSFVPEFENAALSLKDGEIYPQLVESSYGYHIIKLEKKISDTKITQLDNNIYYNVLAIVYEWIENAEIEKGQQFILAR